MDYRKSGEHAGSGDDRARGGGGATGGDDGVESRVARIEERLDTLVSALLDRPVDDLDDRAGCDDRAPRGSASRTDGSRDAGDDPFWALSGLRERSHGTGSVLYTGTVDTGAGQIEYQWSRPTDQILSRDWDRAAGRLAALGHPVRLEMLRLLLSGERTVAEIVDELDLGSSGVAYHHLQQLEAAGWVQTTSRGRRAVPPSRVVALLTMILATEEG